MTEQLDKNISGCSDIQPMIYAYTDTNPIYNGMLKVGYTTVGVAKRVAEQYPTLQPDVGAPYQIVFAESAMYEDGSSFDDHAVHRTLEKMGVSKESGEWFRCTVEDVRAAWLAVKNRSSNV